MMHRLSHLSFLTGTSQCATVRRRPQRSMRSWHLPSGRHCRSVLPQALLQSTKIDLIAFAQGTSAVSATACRWRQRCNHCRTAGQLAESRMHSPVAVNGAGESNYALTTVNPATSIMGAILLPHVTALADSRLHAHSLAARHAVSLAMLQPHRPVQARNKDISNRCNMPTQIRCCCPCRPAKCASSQLVCGESQHHGRAGGHVEHAKHLDSNCLQVHGVRCPGGKHRHVLCYLGCPKRQQHGPDVCAESHAPAGWFG